MKKKTFIFIKFFILIIFVFENTVMAAITDDERSVEKYTNIFKILTGKSIASISRFDLRDVIPENVIVRDQGKANNCWTFATIGALETSLAV